MCSVRWIVVLVATLFGLVSNNMSAEEASKSYPLRPLKPDQKVTITFENYNLASAGVGRDATLLMLKNFQERYPNIKVETKATTSAEMFTSVQAQLVANNPPDLAQLLLREWDLNVANLDPVDLRAILDAKELNDHLNGGEHPMVKNGIALTDRNDKLQGLAYVFSTPTLFYNATLFEQAGLDPNSPPKTWDEVTDYALKIKNKTGADGVYIVGIELDWLTQGLLYSNGASFMNPEQTQIRFGSKEAKEVYRKWQNMVKVGAHVNMTGKDALAAFQTGKLAMYLETSAVQNSVIKAFGTKWRLRAAAQPAWGTKTVVPVPSGSGLAILTRDPVKQRAAWELMKYLTSPEAYTIITRDIGYLPLRPSITKDPKYLANWENLHLVRSNVDQLMRIRPTVSFPNNHLQIRNLFLSSLEKVLFYGGDVDQVFDEAAKTAQKLLES